MLSSWRRIVLRRYRQKSMKGLFYMPYTEAQLRSPFLLLCGACVLYGMNEGHYVHTCLSMQQQWFDPPLSSCARSIAYFSCCRWQHPAIASTTVPLLRSPFHLWSLNLAGLTCPKRDLVHCMVQQVRTVCLDIYRGCVCSSMYESKKNAFVVLLLRPSTYCDRPLDICIRWSPNRLSQQGSQ